MYAVLTSLLQYIFSSCTFASLTLLVLNLPLNKMVQCYVSTCTYGSTLWWNRTKRSRMEQNKRTVQPPFCTEQNRTPKENMFTITNHTCEHFSTQSLGGGGVYKAPLLSEKGQKVGMDCRVRKRSSLEVKQNRNGERECSSTCRDGRV